MEKRKIIGTVDVLENLKREPDVEQQGTGCGTTVHSLLRGNTPLYALAGIQKQNAGGGRFHGMG